MPSLTITPSQPVSRIVEYDSIRCRLWILGQRCHHGATGSVVAALACAGMIAKPLVLHSQPAVPPLMALVAAGGAMMAHDWKDHSIWFERGYGSQP
jgi:hypothetical protein